MRKRIGILIDNLYNYQWSILQGIFSAGEKFDADLFCFVGKTLESPYGYEKQGNLIYNLIDKESVDGLIIFSSAIGSDVSFDKLVNFCNNFSKKIPTVNIGPPIEGIPSIFIDNRTGFQDLLIHLIEDHGYKHIAFIRGPVMNTEADIRYDTLMQVANQYNIEINPDLIYEGNFIRNSGAEAVKTLLDKKNLKFEALVSSNDDMALSALQELKARGIKIPEDIAITGFDDVEETSLVTPPLTTVHQPLYEMGEKSVEMILSIISGKDVPEKVFLPTKPIIRNSCGCEFSGIKRAKVERKEETIELSFEKLKEFSKEFIKYVEENLKNFEKEEERHNLEKIYMSFIEALEEKNPDIFISTLEDILQEKETEIENLSIYQEYISLLRKFLFYYFDKENLHNAENLWHQARVIINDFSERNQGYKRIRTELETESLGYIGRDLISNFEIDSILNQILERLPDLEISSLYIIFYEDKNILSRKGQLIFGYKDRQRIFEDKIFPIKKIIPEEVLPTRRATYIIEPLYFQEDSFGYALFEMGPNKGNIYEILRSQLSAAIQGALLFEIREKYEKTLEKYIEELKILNETGSAISSALELDLLLELIIKQISRIFDFSALYIVLCNGYTKEDKFNIAAKNIKNEEAVISHYDNKRISKVIEDKSPLLKTYKKGKIKSFLAVPIIAGNKAIGSIVLKHCEKEDIYDEHSIEILSTISDFAAVAIENARLFDETKRLATTDPLTSVLNRRALEEVFQKEVAKAQRYDRPLSIIILDLDDFKLFNDTYGHIFGDQALKEMANTLKSSCRKVDVIGRYGGDEFTIILPETNSSGCIRVAKRLLEHIQNTSLVTPDGNKISVSVSMGIASYPEDTSDPEKLLSLADTAMYRAKLAGGNQYLTISSEVSQKESEPKFDTFIGLINAIDSKDNYTFKHCRDVAKYACTLGEVLGLSQEDLGILKIAGELHDIGKIGIPPEILKKPGSLNEEEWKIIKEHPRLGFLILNQLPKMEKLLQAVLHHHERYDGKGYPSGLQGADIPLLARILTVADAYSAMKSNRPYRKALSKKEILKELKTNMGKQFDPEIANKFIELLEKGLID